MSKSKTIIMLMLICLNLPILNRKVKNIDYFNKLLGMSNYLFQRFVHFIILVYLSKINTK